MTKRIIYPTPEGAVAVIVPAPECGLTIEEIAAKDVPTGVEYKIIDVSEVPTDRTFRNAWEYFVEPVVEPEAPVTEEVTE